MKFFFITMALCATAMSGLAQQNRPTTITEPRIDTIYEYTERFDSLKRTNVRDSIISEFSIKGVKEQFILHGIGNVSDETLKNLNAGGKVAVTFVAPRRWGIFPLTYFASFNKNASNTDSLLSTVLVFPEVGSHSFSITPFWMKPGTQNAFFLEFVTKKIKKEVDTANFKSVEYSFQTMHYTAGYTRGYNKKATFENKEYSLGCYFTAFISFVNIPDEDHKNFEKIAGLSARRNDFWAVGTKVAFEINGFQFFADLRTVFGEEEQLPLKDLKGFNSNIGVAFNTEVIKF